MHACTSECLVLLYICTYIILYIILIYSWYSVLYICTYQIIDTHLVCSAYVLALAYIQPSPSINTCTQYSIVAILYRSTPISPELEDLILRLLEKQPELRLTIPEIRVSRRMGCYIPVCSLYVFLYVHCILYRILCLCRVLYFL